MNRKRNWSNNTSTRNNALVISGTLPLTLILYKSYSEGIIQKILYLSYQRLKVCHSSEQFNICSLPLDRGLSLCIWQKVMTCFFPFLKKSTYDLLSYMKYNVYDMVLHMSIMYIVTTILNFKMSHVLKRLLKMQYVLNMRCSRLLTM